VVADTAGPSRDGLLRLPCSVSAAFSAGRVPDLVALQREPRAGLIVAGGQVCSPGDACLADRRRWLSIGRVRPPLLLVLLRTQSLSMPAGATVDAVKLTLPSGIQQGRSLLARNEGARLADGPEKDGWSNTGAILWAGWCDDAAASAVLFRAVVAGAQ
jgi:hypothetical protein